MSRASMAGMTLTTDTRTATLAARLRAARIFAGLDQTDLANDLGVARQTLSNWERDVATVPAVAMIRWAELTRVSVEWLAFGAGVRPEGFEPPTY
jgi:transcriptional regulator with XRE-family HTH domain